MKVKQSIAFATHRVDGEVVDVVVVASILSCYSCELIFSLLSVVVDVC